MSVPSPRNKILPARGNYVDLAANVASLLDGEICYAIDQDQYYQNEGGALVSVGATKAQGALADTSLQPGDNVSTLTNDAGYITLAEVPGDLVTSVAGKTGDVTLVKADIADFSDSDYATAAQGLTADSAIQPLDNVSTLTNDAGYITLAEVPGDLVTSVAGKTGDVTLVKADITDFNEADYATAAQGVTADSATQPLDNVSTLTNDAGYITLGEVPGDLVTSVQGRTGDVTITKTDLSIENVDNTSDANKPVSTAQQTALDAKADLVGGFVPTSQIPAIAITEFLGSVGSEAAMLALTGQPGDWCLRTDKAVGYVITGADPSIVANWEAFTVPGSAVTTINSQVGDVVLGFSDVGAASAAQGTLADTATQPGDNNSTLTNDAGYITLAEVPPDGVTSVNTQTGAVVLDFADVGAASAAQGALADTATQPGDNVSTLTNDAGYITATGTYWTEGTNQLYPADATNSVLIGGTLPSSPNISLNASGSATFAGDVGIGTSSPGELLHISDTSTGGAVGLRVENSEGHANLLANGGGFQFETEASGTVATIDSTGNVGIGGTLPSAPNISLNAVGSAVFGGLVRTPNLQVSTNSDTDGQVAASLYGATGGAVRGLDIKLGTSGTSANALVTFDAKQSTNGALAFATKGVERLRIDQTGDVLIGGTLPSSPNISLNGDGTAAFSSFATFGGGASSSNDGVSILSGGSIRASKASGVDSALDIYTVGTADPTIQLYAGGAATFADDVTASASGDFDNQVLLDSRGAVLAFRETTASTWSSLSASSSVVPSTGYQILSGGNYNAGTRVATTWINSNGSAYFQDQVGIGGTLPSSPNINLDGSAGSGDFADFVQSGSVIVSSTTSGGVRLYPSGQIISQRSAASGTSVYVFRGYSSDTQTSSITAGGAAEFAGAVNSGPISVGTASSTALGVQLSNGGLIRVQRPSTAADNTPVFSGFNGNTENITLTSGGAATFGGLLTVDRDATTLATFDRVGETRFAVGDEGVYLGTDVSPGANPVTGNNITLRTDGSAKYESAIDLTPNNTGVIELRSSDATVQAGSENSNLMRLIANTTQGYTGALISLGKYEDSSFGKGEVTFKVAETSLSANLAEFKFRGDGKTLLPGAVLIGGTLPSAPNISLNANGSADFSGNVTLPGGGGDAQALQKQEIEDLISASSGSGADAWGLVEPNGTLTDGLNVTTVKTGTGTYRATFVTPMPSANYSVVGSCAVAASLSFSSYNRTTASFDFAISTSTANLDANTSFAVFATNATLPATLTQDMLVMKAGDSMTGELIVPSLSSPSGNLPIERASVADSQVQSFQFQSDTADWYPFDPIPTWCNHIRYNISALLSVTSTSLGGFYLRMGTAAGPLVASQVSNSATTEGTVMDNSGNLLYTAEPFAMFASTLSQRYIDYVMDFYIYNRGIGGGSDFYMYGIGSGVYATYPVQAKASQTRMYLQHITPQAPNTVMPDRFGCLLYGGNASGSQNIVQIKQTFLTDGPVGAVADLGPTPTPVLLAP
jgi:hypothetical protein